MLLFMRNSGSAFSIPVGLAFCAMAYAQNLTWLGGGPLPPANTEVKAIAQRSDGRVVIGTKTGGTYVSNAAKSSWGDQAVGLTGGEGQDVKAITVLPDATGTIFVGTKDGVFRSSNGALSFAASRVGL